VSFPGFSDNLRANYNAGTTQVFGELGYRYDVRRLALEPFANLAYVNLRTGRFTEQGGLAALASGGSNNDTTFTTLGLRASTSFMLGAMPATARGGLGWRHAFEDVVPFSTFAFAGSAAFTAAGVPIARDSAVINAGLDFAVTRAATLGISLRRPIRQQCDRPKRPREFGGQVLT
jgi:outer membrane autotransporter protein